MNEKRENDIKTFAYIHFWGAATFGFVSLIMWLSNRNRNRPVATQAFLSLMWNVAYLLIMMVFNFVYVVVLFIQAITGSFGDHGFRVLIVIGMTLPPLSIAVNVEENRGR